MYAIIKDDEVFCVGKTKEEVWDIFLLIDRARSHYDVASPFYSSSRFYSHTAFLDKGEAQAMGYRCEEVLIGVK